MQNSATQHTYYDGKFYHRACIGTDVFTLKTQSVFQERTRAGAGYRDVVL
jgi:hypothetical protein